MRRTLLLFAGFFGVGILSMWVDGVLDWRSTLFVTGLAVVFTAAWSWWIGRASKGDHRGSRRALIRSAG